MIPDSTPLLLALDGDEPWALTWGEFCDENDDLWPELDDVAAALEAGRPYIGGGGAAPVWTVRLA